MVVKFSIVGVSGDALAWRSSLLLSEHHLPDQLPGHALGRDRRLRKNRDFAAVWSRGRGWSNRLVSFRILGNDKGITRLGFAVGRRVGKAVVRNRVKRRLREHLRQRILPESWDIVVAARPATAGATYRELGQAMDELLRRAGLLVVPVGESVSPPKDTR